MPSAVVARAVAIMIGASRKPTAQQQRQPQTEYDRDRPGFDGQLIGLPRNWSKSSSRPARKNRKLKPSAPRKASTPVAVPHARTCGPTTMPSPILDHHDSASAAGSAARIPERCRDSDEGHEEQRGEVGGSRLRHEHSDRHAWRATAGSSILTRRCCRPLPRGEALRLLARKHQCSESYFGVVLAPETSDDLARKVERALQDTGELGADGADAQRDHARIADVAADRNRHAREHAAEDVPNSGILRTIRSRC